MAERNTYNWFDSAPFDVPYPWRGLNIPWTASPFEANCLAEQIKQEGNECFRNGDYYDALWKYEHSLTLLSFYPTLRVHMPVVLCNVAACCLKLGDEGRVDLIHDAHLRVFMSEKAWYLYCNQYATQALSMEPEAKIAYKAHWRRGESAKKIFATPEMVEAVAAIVHNMPGGGMDPIELMVTDYVRCFVLQENPEPKVLLEAIVLAVEHDRTSLLPVLSTKHVKCGVPTSVLREMIASPSMTSDHLNCLLLEITIECKVLPHFDVAWLDPTSLLKKRVYSVEAYKKLVRCDMTVTPSCVEYAVQWLTKGKLELFKLLVSECAEGSNLVKASDLATSLKKKYFLDILKEVAENSFDKLRESGNVLFSKGQYEEALSKYFQAINYCKKRNMKDEIALIRANCAQACLRLELYSDAYTHSCECIRLDPQNHKGYFRRAEALRLMQETSATERGTHMDLVKDYLKCHSLQSSVEAFCKAIVIAVEQKCTRLIPKLRHPQVTSGFSDRVLQHIMEKATLTEPLLEFVCLKLPDPNETRPYNAGFISLKTILRVTTMIQVVTSMISYGASILEADVIAAGIHIPNDRSLLLDCILGHCVISSDESYQTAINIACSEAMKTKRTLCVAALMRCGATPHPEELLRIPGILNEPVVRRYYQVLNSVQATAGQVENVTEPGDDVDNARIKAHIGVLNSKAKGCFKANKIEDALQYYREALCLCQDRNMQLETASLHNNLAHLFLVLKQYKKAYSNADECIRIMKNNAKAYFRRGEALRNAIKKGEYNVKAPDSLSHVNVLSDFKKSYGLKKDVKVLLEGVPFASEYDLSDFFYDECAGLTEDECLQLLKEVMSRKSCRSETLAFLTKVWKTKKVDCTGVNLRVLLTEKKVSDMSTLSWFLASGIIVDGSDIQTAIQCLADKKVESFKLLLGKCDHIDKDLLCQETLKARKMSFLLHLLNEGAALPKDHEAIIHQLLSSKNFSGVETVVKLLSRECFEKMDLSSLLLTNLVHHHKLIGMFIEAGVSPNGRKPPIVTVMGLTHLKAEAQVELVCLLLKCGASCAQLSQTARFTTTPLHVATELSLKIGNTEIIDVVVPLLTAAGYDKFVNEKGESPLHIAVKPHIKRDVSMNVLSALLSKDLISPSQKDKTNKRPTDYLKPGDPRIKILQEHAKGDSSKPKKKQKKKKKGGDSERVSKEESAKVVVILDDGEQKTDLLVDKSAAEPVALPQHKPVPKKETLYENRTAAEKLTHHLDIIFSKGDHFFSAQSGQKDGAEGMEQGDNHATFLQVTSPRHQLVPPFDKQKVRSPTHTRSTQGSPHSSPRSEPLSGSSVGSPAVSLAEFGLDERLPDFDALPWEVEITRNVVKFFKNTKKYSEVDRIRTADVIYQIAEGKRNHHLSKSVSNNPDVCLYEARITQSGRMLWEKAIAYSSRLTGDSECAVYTQVIRVWEVILDHDDLETKINYYVDQVEHSYKRGDMSSIRWSLKPLEIGREVGQVRGQDVLAFPSTYVVQSQDLLNSKYRFVPAASTKDTEYNVTTFYSFDTMTVKSMISGTNDRRDYPFKEWQKEHEIIKIKSSEAILLLGRSGTGKTTCCLYRLWNEFKNHWDPLSQTYGIKIPRKALVSTSSLQSEEDNETQADEFLSGTDSEQQAFDSEVGNVDCNGIDGSDSPDVIASDDEGDDDVLIEENLHQIFVTKNYVLCDQMKKRFYSMAAAYDFLESHLSYEDITTPNSFGNFEDLSFPAFVTARQFYILLDNSLEDGKSFFKRDGEGNLQVKIVSLDYDHEDRDLLWDLDESDSEDEELEVMHPTSDQQAQRQQRTEKWTEVTALYFKEVVWPKISRQCKLDGEIDPMLVWLEIQSFIKGSSHAVEKGLPLSLEEYVDIGNRMAPNFSSHRELIYKLYRYYRKYTDNQRYHCYLFDECDLILNLHRRLNEVKDVSWSIHSVYIDEVQDFTQAELAIFIHCCRDPNSMFFTGDTAQSIMRGIAFRFQDLRSCFHRLNNNIPSISVPQKPLNLTINYRSHSGILKLAGTIIDLIKEFFRDSIDHLPDDEGMFPGPVPVFMDSCKEEDLSLLLSTNKRECSAIEFGAHQVILVQSKEAKDKLPQILKGAIVLTIFEAKGLEFDDVLLYNFFSDSMVDERVWRVVASYLEIPSHHEKIKNEDPLPGSSGEARSKAFDAVQHKSLNAELKYLYTAITRAKCNLWIYDSDIKARLPMLEHWHKRNAVKVVTADTSADQRYGLVFASNSTPDQWKAQGDNFRKKHLWEQAILCYQRAGSDYLYLVKEAQAYHLIQGARQHKPALFYEAALRFLECCSLRHSLQCLTGAALCLKNSRPPRYTQAAKLFEGLGDAEKAAQLYLKAKDYDNFERVQESRGEYDSVIRSLLGKSFLRKRDALAKVDEYEKKGYPIDPKYTTSELSFSCAKFYSERRDKQTLLEVLKYMPEQDKRVKFMKEAELYEEAYADYVSSQQFSGAYRLALAHGWFSRAISLAERLSDSTHLAQFVLLEAKSHFCKNSTDSQAKPVDHQILSNLRKFTSDKNELVKAEANLLLGMIQGSHGSCVKALQVFKMKDHKAGILESFDRLKEVSDQEVLNCCHIAKKLAKTLREAKDMLIDVQQTVKFYGFQLLGKAYLTSRYGHCFITFTTLLKCTCEDSQHDFDSMVRLNPNVRNLLAERYETFLKTWIGRHTLDTKLYAKCRSFNLHSDLWKNRRLSRQYSLQQLSSEAMLHYIQNCVYVLELRLLRNETVDGTLAHFEVIFSPDVSMCLTCLNSQHVHAIRRSANSLISFKTKIEKDLNHLCEEKSDKSDPEKPVKLLIDSWLSVWRLSSISYPSMKFILAKLEQIEEKVRDIQRRDPLGYIFWKNERRHLHIFRFWLYSCTEIRDNYKVLWAAKLAITHFLGNVVENKQISISILNIVNVLTIHSMALLAMMTHSNALKNLPQKFTVPQIYKHVVEMFNHMNCRKATKDSSLFSACVKEVSSNRSLWLFSECRKLLNTALNYLVGAHERAPKYSVLRFGLHKFPKTEQTQQCVILTFTIFGNLSLIQNVRKYEDKIMGIFKEFAARNQTLPIYVERVLNVYSMQSQVHNRVGRRSESVLKPDVVFNLVNEFLVLSRKEGTISRITFKQKQESIGHIEVTPMPSKLRRATQVNNPSTGATQAHLANKSEPSSEKSMPSDYSTPAIQGSIEHGDQFSSNVLNPGMVAQMDPFNPSMMPYPPTVQNPVGVVESIAPHPADPSGMFLPSTTVVNPAVNVEMESTFSYHHQHSDLSQVTPEYRYEAMPAFPSSSTTAGFPSRPLSALADQFVPHGPIPDGKLQEVSSPISDQSPSLGVVTSPGAEYSVAESLFDFEDNELSQVPADDDYGIVEGAVEDLGEYMLTQPQKPSVYINPCVTTEEIVDEDNHFCNACGVKYREDDHLDLDDDQNEARLESYLHHFAGHHHHETAMAFLAFLETNSKGDQNVSLAQEKLKECEDLKHCDETVLLDQSIENLKEEIHMYNLVSSEVQENRLWKDGEKKMEKSLTTLRRLIDEANDQLRKADVARIREEQFKKKQMMLEEMEDEEEMEKMRDSYVNEIHASGKGHKVRTEEDKFRSRTKKKQKRRK